MKSIQEAFPISNEEFKELNEKYGSLAYYASWQLARKNTKNNHQNDIDDFQQNLLMGMVRAGSYFKRQIFIEKCFEVAEQYATDEFLMALLTELKNLWNDRTRHGASRQKFGNFQERLLNNIVMKVVPKSKRPNRQQQLDISPLFARYCKQIIWNEQRSMGKKITREKPLRSGQVSLSQYSYMGNNLL